LYTAIVMLHNGSVSKFSPQVYAKITKYYTKPRECCTDIIKSLFDKGIITYWTNKTVSLAWFEKAIFMVLLPSFMRKKHEPKNLQNTTLLHSQVPCHLLLPAQVRLEGYFGCRLDSTQRKTHRTKLNPPIKSFLF
jgi:hypothetical protein